MSTLLLLLLLKEKQTLWCIWTAWDDTTVSFRANKTTREEADTERMSEPLLSPEAEHSGNVDDGNEANTQLLELQDALMHALSMSGALGKLRAQLRATAIGLFRGDADLQHAAVGSTMSPGELPVESRLTLLLLHDFLQERGLEATAGVLEAESGMRIPASEERDALLGQFSPLPGQGTLLERVVHYAVNASNDGTHSGRPLPATASGLAAVSSTFGQPRPVDSVGMADVSSTMVGWGTAPEVAPEDADVAEGLENYENSIDFDDVEGTIDVAEYDEVETPV